MIALCKNCKPHEYQDKKYGKNIRVFNPKYKSGSRQIVGYRCTVCGTSIDAPKESKKDSVKESREI